MVRNPGNFSPTDTGSNHEAVSDKKLNWRERSRVIKTIGKAAFILGMTGMAAAFVGGEHQKSQVAESNAEGLSLIQEAAEVERAEGTIVISESEGSDAGASPSTPESRADALSGQQDFRAKVLKWRADNGPNHPYYGNLDEIRSVGDADLATTPGSIELVQKADAEFAEAIEARNTGEAIKGAGVGVGLPLAAGGAALAGLGALAGGKSNRKRQ